MKFPRMTIGLPLLLKELVEQSARRRTYVIRIVYACLLFLIAYMMFYEILRYTRYGNGLFGVLGRGREVFEALVILQFFGVFLFMPAITCTVLTVEKERHSLELLFLTRLGPWTILMEKLLGRLVPMFMFLIMSLPLLAFAYSLGGITQRYMWSGIWLLAITAMQVGSLAVMCSAFFRTTVGAFIGSYLIGAAFYFSLPCVFAILDEFRIYNWSRGTDDFIFMFFGPYLFDKASRNVDFLGLLIRSIPILASSALFLIVARVFVIRRAFIQPRNLLLNLFKILDRVFVALNDRFARGITLTRESTALPKDEPIAWRETTKKSLGTVRYLFRVFMVLEIPVAVICILQAHASDVGYHMEWLSAVLFTLWIISILIISVKSTSLVSSERSHETLDVLLTTPLTSQEIILQKFRGVRRLILVLLVPFLTIFIFEGLVKGNFTGGSYRSYYPYYYREFSGPLYLVCSFLSVAIYLPLMAWLSLWIGLKVRSQARAIISSLAAIVAWCLGPLMLLGLIFMVTGPPRGDGLKYFLFLSPMMIVPMNEFGELERFVDYPWTALIVNFLIYGGILFWIRHHCLTSSDWFFGRTKYKWGPPKHTLQHYLSTFRK